MPLTDVLISVIAIGHNALVFMPDKHFGSIDGLGSVRTYRRLSVLKVFFREPF